MEHETRKFAGSTDRCHLGAGSDRRLHDQRINMSQSTVPFEIIRLHGGMDGQVRLMQDLYTWERGRGEGGRSKNPGERGKRERERERENADLEV